MPSWFEQQIAERRKLDDEQLEAAFAQLAASVVGSSGAPRFTIDDVKLTDDAIASVLRYYGARPTHVPDSITDPTERIEYAMRSCGIMKRPVVLEGAWWRDATGAYLGHLKDGETVALLPDSVAGYAYLDPVSHHKVHVNAKTAEALAPEALCFYRPLPARELSLADLMVFIGKSLDGVDYVLLVVASIAVTLVGMLPGLLNNILFGRVIPSGAEEILLPIVVLLVSVAIATSLITATRDIVMARFSTKLDVQIQAATMGRVVLLPPKFFKDYASGDLANRTMAMSQVAQVLAQSVIGTSLSSLLSLAYVVQIFTFTPALVLPALLVIILQTVVSTMITLITLRYNRKEMEANSKLSGMVPALLNAITKIKLAGAEKRAFARWADVYSAYATTVYDRPSLVKASSAFMMPITTFGTIIIYYVAGVSNVSMADFMTFNVCYGAAMAGINQLAQAAMTVATMQPLLELVEPIMKTVPEVEPGKRAITSLTGSIEMQHVTFRYVENGPTILDDLSLKIRSGEYVAIVGRTGCGKSTLLRCLLGFEQPEKGAVLYNGQDIANVDVRSLRSNIGVVMQNGSLFMGDMFTNIIIANPRATMEDAWEAADMAGVGDTIRAMPMGMQTVITEGSGGISGGQKQRILIARAVCGKPRILMLDEATSALDNVTQRQVSDALAGLKCTRVVIAHRLSTIKQADRIILLDNGHIAEEGTYDQLIARGGQFAELVERQRLEGE